MAHGVDTVPEWQLKNRGARRWKDKRSAFSKKIAVQFTPDQFARINAYCDSKGISFAAAVRRLIFEKDDLP